MTTGFVTDQRLRRSERLRGRRNFARVFGHRCIVSDSELVVYVAVNNLDHARIGIVVSRRMGNAVARASVRRRIREFFRKNKQTIPCGYDYLCLPKPATRARTWEPHPLAMARLFANAAKKLSDRNKA